MSIKCNITFIYPAECKRTNNWWVVYGMMIVGVTVAGQFIQIAAFSGCQMSYSCRIGKMDYWLLRDMIVAIKLMTTLSRYGEDLNMEVFSA